MAAQIGRLAQVERQPQSIERRPPFFAIGQRTADHRQTVGFEGAITGALIGDIGGGGGAVEQQRAFLRVARLDLQHGVARAAASSPASAGSTATTWPSTVMPVRKSFFWNAASASRRQRRRGLAGRTGIALDLGFELDRRVVNVPCAGRACRQP
ncbi:MAG: hypothetical protein WDN48_12545 [Pseudolabrys sp.]